MTLAQLEALEAQRAPAIRHARFNSALVASALININRAPDTDALSPYDFLPGFETDPEEVEKEKERKSIRHAIRVALAEMHCGREEILAERDRIVERLRKSGIEDPEELVREAYPDL